WLGTDPRDGDGMLRLEARLDALSGATVRAALEPLARPTRADDPRTCGQRLADALVALAQMALDGGNLPQTAVQRPHVLLITTPDTPRHSHPTDTTHTPAAEPSRLDGVGPVSADTARQVCCDADTTPITVDRNGEILDVGRSRRDPTPAQRKAVLARDQTCVGCGAPANRCHIHHIRWWRHHGATDLHNLTLLCWTCHHNIHHNNWTITTNPDGGYTANPPDPPDPPHPRHTPRNTPRNTPRHTP
ncbi:MAG: HNH endonuclease, partial [Actinomycetota bacterium]|nr:HNH endonuclease [Actinomycetota bacterium]